MLKLLCLLSLVSGGVSRSDYAKLRRDFCHAYGFHHAPTTFIRLQKAGLFTEKANYASNSEINLLNQRLGLLPRPRDPESDQGQTPDSVFNGLYTPVVSKIVGDIVARANVEWAKYFMTSVELNPRLLSKRASKTALVYFVGGYTQAEVASLRFLERSIGCSIIIAGTGPVRGKDIVCN